MWWGDSVVGREQRGKSVADPSLPTLPPPIPLLRPLWHAPSRRATPTEARHSLATGSALACISAMLLMELSSSFLRSLSSLLKECRHQGRLSVPLGEGSEEGEEEGRETDGSREAKLKKESPPHDEASTQSHVPAMRQHSQYTNSVSERQSDGYIQANTLSRLSWSGVASSASF